MLIAVGTVVARHHPVGAALEDAELFGLLRDLGNELDGAGRVPDDGHPSSGEIVRVIPACRGPCPDEADRALRPLPPNCPQARGDCLAGNPSRATRAAT